MWRKGFKCGQLSEFSTGWTRNRWGDHATVAHVDHRSTPIRRNSFVCGALLAGVWFVSPLDAVAQSDANVTSAREIAKEGLAAYDAGRYEEANDKLSRALEVVGVPTLALFTARSNVKLGRWVRASELYFIATRLSAKGSAEAIQLNAQRDAEKERSELLPRIPRLTVVIEGASRNEVSLSLDEQPVARALIGTSQLVDPGRHVVFAKRGNEEVRDEVTTIERENRTTTLVFKASQLLAQTPQPDSIAKGVVAATDQPKAERLANSSSSTSGGTQATVGWVSLGVGSAGLFVGAGTGIWLLAERSRLHNAGCNGGTCYTDQKDETDRFNNMRIVSGVGFVSGAVLATAGLTLILSAPKQRASAAGTMLVVGPNFASVRGCF